jgi:glycosyltransferase involved in cell wall biosynthesis
MTKPKITRIFNRLILGGPVLNALILTKHLSDEFDTDLLTGMKDATEEDADALVQRYGATPIYVKQMRRSLNPFQDLRAYLDIRKFLKEHRPNIVHTHASKPGLLGRLAAHHLGVPVVLHTFHGHAAHNYFGPLKTKLYILTERYLATKSTRIIAISEQQKHELGTIYKICKPEKIVIVPLGLDLDSFYEDQERKRAVFREKYQVKNDEIAIGIIGRLVPIKNHSLFIRAIKLVLEKTKKKLKIFIVGDGDEKDSICSLLQELNIPFNYYPTDQQSKTVTLTSWISKMDDVYAGLDLVCLSSLNEGTPVSLIEAQAASKPIVTTRVGGVADVVLENQTALITPTGEVEPFAEAILKLTEDDSLRIEFGKMGYEQVKQKYDKSRLVSDIKSLYRELLKETGSAASDRL